MAVGRGAEDTANSTAAAQSTGYYDNSQNSYSQAQGAEGNFENQLGQYGTDVATFAGSNPYGQGGQDQTATNQQLSNTAGAAAASAGQNLQSQALRTGQNSNADIAATEQMQEQNTRNLGAQEASATQSRIGSQAGYNAQALSAQQGALNEYGQPVSAETSLSGQQGNLNQAALGNQIKAGETPSFEDELGSAVPGIASSWLARPKS
jgi:hypothetical protein